MRKKLLVFLTLLLVPLQPALARDPIPIESLSRMQEIQSISMSPDGRRIVALIGKTAADEFQTSLATWDLDNLGRPPIITASGGQMKFVAAAALKSDHIFLVGRQEWTGAIGECGGEGNSLGSTKTFVTKAYLTDATHSEFEEAFADNRRPVGVSEATQRCFEIFGSAQLVDPLPLDPVHVIVQQTNMGTLRSDFYRYNLGTGSTELLFRATGQSAPVLFDQRTGDVLVKNELKPASGGFETRFLIRNDSSRELELHPNLSSRVEQRFVVDFVGRDEKSGKYYVITDKFSDHTQARMYDPTTRQFDPEPLVAHPNYSVIGLILGTQPSDFNQILGYRIGKKNVETTWIDPTLLSIHEGLKQAFPNRSIEILSFTDDRNRILFSTESPRHSPRYYLLTDRSKVKHLGAQRNGIRPDQIGEQRWVSYDARDGLNIPAILDLPAGWTSEQGAVPAVILPHGGPWARDFGGWDVSGWVPFLTSRGLAVLRPQYRGSTGLGRNLWLAGDAQWGLKMQDDKDDGAKWLIEQGIADPNRIVIFGYSYGGFAAAAAVVRPDSPYVCAISGAPVTDLARLSNTWSENRLQRAVQGKTVRGMDPMRNTEHANIPTLLFVGDRDVRTPAWHARNFYNAIRSHVSARFSLIPDQPHSFPWYPRHNTQIFNLIEDFLNTECGIETGELTG